MTTKKIALQTWGSDGDIHPFLALAKALVKRGHSVTLAVTSAEHKSYGAYADRFGFSLVEAGFMIPSVEKMREFSKRMLQVRHPLKQTIALLDEVFRPSEAELHRVALELCASHDALISHFVLHPAQAAAEKTKTPFLTVTLNQAIIPSSIANPPGFPDFRFLNRANWALAVPILERVIGSRINRFRSEIGLSPVRSFRDVLESRQGNLIAVSPQLCPRAPEWERHQIICGFFPTPEKESGAPLPESLERFLSEGPQPVYLTFGSMLAAQEEQQILDEGIELLHAAALASGSRAIVQAPWSRCSLAVPESKSIYRIERAEHRRVFPRCSLIVHHGGAGTTQTSSFCGKPSIIVAHAFDQYFWARELKRLGVAPSAMDARRATSKRLARSIRKTLMSSEMVANADFLGKKLREEDGPARAVGFIESALNLC